MPSSKHPPDIGGGVFVSIATNVLGKGLGRAEAFPNNAFAVARRRSRTLGPERERHGALGVLFVAAREESGTFR